MLLAKIFLEVLCEIFHLIFLLITDPIVPEIPLNPILYKPDSVPFVCE